MADIQTDEHKNSQECVVTREKNVSLTGTMIQQLLSATGPSNTTKLQYHTVCHKCNAAAYQCHCFPLLMSATEFNFNSDKTTIL